MTPENHSPPTFRRVFRAYVFAHAPRMPNGLPIIDRDVLDAATLAGQQAVAAAESADCTPSSTGTVADGLVRG